MLCANWPRRGTGKIDGIWKRSGWRSIGERVITSPSYSTAISTASSTSIERASRARSRFRRISRSTATRRISRPARPTCPRVPSASISGLAWRVHRREVLPLLERVIPYLRAPELQQAADDILERMNEPETAEHGGRNGDEDQRSGASARAVCPAGAAAGGAMEHGPRTAEAFFK